jgi:hypothetical protein
LSARFENGEDEGVRRGKLGAVLLGVLALGALACGSTKPDHKSNAAPDASCTQGTAYSCVGSRGCMGMQYCLISGELGACVCPGPVLVDEAGPRDAAAERDAASMTTRPMDAAAPKSDSAVVAPPPHDASASADAQVHDASPHVMENCGNGVDDDGDGKIDCADEDCGAYSCVAAAPDGWTGPLALYVGSDATPTCSGNYGSEALRGGSAVNATPAVCSSCSCTPQTASCASYLGFGFGAQSNCSDAGCMALIGASCVEVAPSCLTGMSTAYVQTQFPPGTSSCAPSTQTPAIADASFSDHVLGCGASDGLRRGGCSPGNLCAAATPFTGPFCIVKAGDLACPSGPYSDRRVYFTAIDDTRDCGACACGSDCSYTWKIFDDADTTCATPLATQSGAGSCTMVTPSSGKLRVGASISGTGTCAPSGGQATGSAAGAGATTACCLP